MDEQLTMPTTPNSWDAGADGPAYAEPISDGDGASTVSTESGNISLREDGEVEIRDEFFGDIGSEAPDVPNKYTPDELRQTPYEEWDISRLEGDVREYLPYVQEQVQRRQMEYQLRNSPPQPPMYTEPKQYTAKELAEDAQKLACERLGLNDPDDFDEYETEHRAALNLAMQELANRRNAEVAEYQRVSEDYRDLQNFNAQLIRQPDYLEVDRWFSGKMREAGVTPAQVNAGLMEYIRRSGGDFRNVKGVIADWYQEFRGESSRARPNVVNRPPVLEGSGGNAYEGRRSVNMRNFGNLDPDAQAAALMRMGIV